VHALRFEADASNAVWHRCQTFCLAKKLPPKLLIIKAEVVELADTPSDHIKLFILHKLLIMNLLPFTSTTSIDPPRNGQCAKERGLDYAIVIQRVGGGSEASFMEMAKEMMQAGSAGSLSEVFKLYADGHEEPLRGVHIADLPAESFKEIVATRDTPYLYSDELVPRISSLFFYEHLCRR